MAPTYTNETITTSNDQALHTHNITNNDLQSVYNIELVCVENEIPLSCDEVRGDSVEGEFAGTDTGHATYPDNDLSPAASLTGSLTDEVSQVQVSSVVEVDAIEKRQTCLSINPKRSNVYRARIS